jgi:hypothetical protein
MTDDVFTVADLHTLGSTVADAWLAGADRDWSVPAGSLEWSCRQTADHAVDGTFAPAFFLASRRMDRYPDAGDQFTVGPDATAAQLVEALEIAVRVLAAVVQTTDPAVRAILFQRPEPTLGAPPDFLPRGAMELILHAHDVCAGLQVPFEPHADLCARLREHTRPWAMWTYFPGELGHTDDPWADLLLASGRARQP